MPPRFRPFDWRNTEDVRQQRPETQRSEEMTLQRSTWLLQRQLDRTSIHQLTTAKLERCTVG